MPSIQERNIEIAEEYVKGPKGKLLELGSILIVVDGQHTLLADNFDDALLREASNSAIINIDNTTVFTVN